MKIFRSKTAIAVASAAVLSMTATPVFARGWHKRHRGIDGGDVVAGILILGGIAAIASAASNANKNKRYRDSRYPDARDRDYRDRDYRDEDYRDRDYRDRSGSYGSERDNRYGEQGARGAGNIDGAVSACRYEVERNNRRIDSIDAANRQGDDWRVEGRMTSGSDFACTVGSDMRIRSVTIDGRGIT